ncbi:hypothetical protein [Kordia sp.]|uniref:hypothetical protein n=1 Tax=Kordia sp. TaxID=1965332 RepID=UPI003B5AFBA1
MKKSVKKLELKKEQIVDLVGGAARAATGDKVLCSGPASSRMADPNDVYYTSRNTFC